eukprot:273717-Amorphochlora_amoeboformis.AAC.2
MRIKAVLLYDGLHEGLGCDAVRSPASTIGSGATMPSNIYPTAKLFTGHRHALDPAVPPYNPLKHIPMENLHTPEKYFSRFSQHADIDHHLIMGPFHPEVQFAGKNVVTS